MDNEHMECSECSGVYVQCPACVHNKALIARLKRQVKELQAEVGERSKNCKKCVYYRTIACSQCNDEDRYVFDY